MRPTKSYLHCIVNAKGQSLYVASYDNQSKAVIKTSSRPNWLEFSARNWKDVEVAFGRDINKYHGINRTFSQAYEFVNDGADIIRSAIYTKGYNEKIYLIILQHNTDNDTYEGYYKGQIDLKEIVDNQPSSVSVNLLEGGLISLFNSNDDTEYEFPFDSSAIEFIHDGIDLKSTLRYQVVPLEEYFHLNHIIPISFLTNEGFGTGIEYKEQNYENSSSTYSANSANWLYRNDDQQTIQIEGEIKVTLLESSGVNQLRYQLGYMISPAANFTFFSPIQILTDGSTGTFTVNTTITVPANQKLFLGGRAFVTNAGDNVQFKAKWETTKLSIRLKTRKASSIIKAYKPFTLLEKLFGKIANGLPVNVNSSLLLANNHIVVTSGDAVRGIETATLKTSFKDFFDDVNARLMAALSFNGLDVHLEDRRTVYNNAIINQQNGEVSDLVIELAKELLFNKIKVGYQSKTYDDLNGRLEPNTTATFTTTIDEKKELNLISPYRADPYGGEYLRINLEGKTTTDNSGDNDIFIFNIKEREQIEDVLSINWLKSSKRLRIFFGQPHQSKFPVGSTFKILNSTSDLFNSYYTVVSTSITGIDLDVFVSEEVTPTIEAFTANIYFPATLNRDVTLLTGDLPTSIYNIAELTPKWLLLRHGSWIRSVHYLMDHLSLEFQTLDKNKELSYIYKGKTIVEKSNVEIGSLEQRFFHPFIFKCRTRIPDNFHTVMKDALNAHVEILYNSRPLYGFPLNMSAKPVFKEAQEWKLLASTSNNIDYLLNLEPLVITTALLFKYNMEVSYLCPLQFVPIGNKLPQYNTVHMDKGFWSEQMTSYIQRSPYQQKWQFNDGAIPIQIYTTNLAPVQIDVLDCYGKIVLTVALSNVITSAISSPYLLYEGNINVDNLDAGFYSVLLTAGLNDATVQFISEVIDLQEFHPNTMQFLYSNRKNKLRTIFTTGYVGKIRMEAMLTNYTPKLNMSNYEDEPANMELLEGIPYDVFTLEIGKGTFGMPNYMAKKLNAVMGLTDVFIDGMEFTRDEDAQMEVERLPGVAGSWFSLSVRKGENNLSVSNGTNGNLNDSGVAVIYSINTELFGDLNGQASSNLVQVTKQEKTD